MFAVSHEKILTPPSDRYSTFDVAVQVALQMQAVQASEYFPT